MQASATDSISQVQFNAADLRLALRDNNELYIHFAIPDQLTLGVPQLHIELVDLNTNPRANKQAEAVPRGHAKTTMVKVAISKKIFFTHKQFFVYCTDTGPVAKAACRDIVSILKQPNFTHTFGEQIWEKENESEGLFIVKIQCWANLEKPYTKTVVIRALGSGQQIRGLNVNNRRPDDLTVDDGENDEIVNTEEQREKYIRWLYGTLFKACSQDASIIYIGNLIDNRCALAKLLNDPDWHAVRYGCIKSNGEPLWPEMFSMAAIRKEFQEFKRRGLLAKWFAEMMNMPMPEGLAIIQVEEIEYRPIRVPADLEMAFIVIDPAISKRNYRDKTSLTVHGLVENRWQICETLSGQMDPIETFWTMVKLCQYWRVTLVGIETTAFQAAYQFFFPILLEQYKQQTIQVVPLSSEGRKIERILVWASWLKDKTYVLTENENQQTTQLLTFDTKKDDNEDDDIDSASYGPQMIGKYLGMMSLSLDIAHKGFQDSSLVCTI